MQQEWVQLGRRQILSPGGDVIPTPTKADIPHDGWQFCLHALNAVRCPALAIDDRGFVLGVNEAMDSVLDEDIRIESKRLLIANAQARGRLYALIRSLASSKVRTPLQEEPIVVVRDNGRQPVVIKRLPPMASNKLEVCSILTFFSLDAKPCPPASLLMKIFCFTPAEARLAAALAKGMTLGEAAIVKSISCNTLRHQLKAVFLKTNTHRQSHLVALLAQL